MIKCLLSRPGLIAGPLHSTPLPNNSQLIPRLDPIDSKSSFYILIIKVWISAEFRRRGNYVNKFIHVLENINYATPFSDWDEGDHSIQEFRVRFRATCREMAAIFCVNIICTILMLVPLWYTGIMKYLFNFIYLFKN